MTDRDAQRAANRAEYKRFVDKATRDAERKAEARDKAEQARQAVVRRAGKGKGYK